MSAQDLFVDEEVARALHQGIERGRRRERLEHECRPPERRPYPHELMQRVDDLADAAWEVLGDQAYDIATAVDEWFKGDSSDGGEDRP